MKNTGLYWILGIAIDGANLLIKGVLISLLMWLIATT